MHGNNNTNNNNNVFNRKFAKNTILSIKENLCRLKTRIFFVLTCFPVCVSRMQADDVDFLALGSNIMHRVSRPTTDQR